MVKDLRLSALFSTANFDDFIGFNVYSGSLNPLLSKIFLFILYMHSMHSADFMEEMCREIKGIKSKFPD